MLSLGELSKKRYLLVFQHGFDEIGGSDGSHSVGRRFDRHTPESVYLGGQAFASVTLENRVNFRQSRFSRFTD